MDSAGSDSERENPEARHRDEQEDAAWNGWNSRLLSVPGDEKEQQIARQGLNRDSQEEATVVETRGNLVSQGKSSREALLISRIKDINTVRRKRRESVSSESDSNSDTEKSTARNRSLESERKRRDENRDAVGRSDSRSPWQDSSSRRKPETVHSETENRSQISPDRSKDSHKQGVHGMRTTERSRSKSLEKKKRESKPEIRRKTERGIHRDRSTSGSSSSSRSRNRTPVRRNRRRSRSDSRSRRRRSENDRRKSRSHSRSRSRDRRQRRDKSPDHSRSRRRKSRSRSRSSSRRRRPQRRRSPSTSSFESN